MNKFLFCTLGFVLLLMVNILSSCQKDAIEQTNPSEQTSSHDVGNASLNSRTSNAIPDINLLADYLAFELKNNTVGYSLKVSYKNQAFVSRSGGWARLQNDNPAKPMGVDVKYHTASVTKTITATALIHVLSNSPNAYNMIDWPVWPYLPAHWTFGPNIKTITFRDLLTHKSGFRNGLNDSNKGNYQQLKTLVANGIMLSNKSVASYNNRNFALMRLLIPVLAKKYAITIWNPNLYSPNQLVNVENTQAIELANAYKDYCRKAIFSKLTSCANQTIDCLNTDLFFGLNYSFPVNGSNGTACGNLTMNAGGEGWVLTTNEMHDFFNTLHYTEKILPKILTDLMKTQLLGYDVKGNTKYGVSYYWKNGIYNFGTSGNVPAYRSLILGFGDDIQISILTNSAINLQDTALKNYESWYYKKYKI